MSVGFIEGELNAWGFLCVKEYLIFLFVGMLLFLFQMSAGQN